ncbi:MAG: hypothetical protein K6E34_10360 [Lachnospiraceae bacterium]|nr:hypothetical protein [Lachnospiraceae bacterium]
MNSPKSIITAEEKKNISTDITDSKTNPQTSEEAVTKEQKGYSDFAALFQVMRFPATKGPLVVTKHSAKAGVLAIAVQALVKGFFVLCLYHSLNQKLLLCFVTLGNTISNGLRNASAELMDFLVKTLIFNISKIPVLGETLSNMADQYLSDYLTLLATGISTKTNDLLYNLYPAVCLPEGIGFLTGVLASLIGIGLCALILKLFLAISKHPFQSFPEIFSLLSIRCVISMPIVFVAAILSIFFPIAGIVLLPLAALFGMCYMFAVLFRSNNEISENRFVYVLPFIIIVTLIISVLTASLEGIAAASTICMRLEAFSQTLQ